ncbi:MAG: hypothetical protein ACOH5I_24860 [Oligoflexus sp.]
MIRKYLICGNPSQVFLQSKNTDAYYELGRVIELIMPIREFWGLSEQIKTIHYMVSANESTTEVATAYKKLMKSSAPFAVREEDRVWLYDKGKT